MYVYDVDLKAYYPYWTKILTMEIS